MLIETGLISMLYFLLSGDMHLPKLIIDGASVTTSAMTIFPDAKGVNDADNNISQRG